jgi:hypothetical protein
MLAIVDRLKDALNGDCLPRHIATYCDGVPACPIIEVTRYPDAAPCSNDLPGRSHPEPSVRDAVLSWLRSRSLCGVETTSCSQFQICMISVAGEFADDPSYQECLHADDTDIETAAGYCYIDATTDRNTDGVVNCTPECYDADSADCDCIGDPAMVASCPPDQRRRFRFVAPADSEVPIPWPNAWLFWGCNSTLQLDGRCE